MNLSKKNYIAKRSKWLPKIAEWIKAHGGGTSIPFSVEYEEELFEAKKAGGPDAVKAIVEANGGAKSVLPRIIKCGYKELNLIYFFTAGEKEVRAWNIYNGSLAPQAAGVIHGDFERGFIKAETVGYEALVDAGDEKAAKEAGLMRSEGKEYVVKDGDVMLFRFNV